VNAIGRKRSWFEPLLKGRRHDAEDGVRLAIEPEGSADHVAAAAELFLPETVGEHDDVARACCVFAGAEHPAEHRWRAEGSKIATGDPCSGDADGITVAGEIVAGAALRIHAVEEVGGVLRPIEIVGRCDGERRILGKARFPDGNQSLGFGIGNRAEQDGIDDGENRRARADAEREGEHDNGAKTGRPAQRARRVAEILEKLFEPHEPSLAARALLDLLHATELPLRGVARFVRRHPIVHVIRRALLKMKPHLFGHVAVEFFFAEKRAEFSEQLHQSEKSFVFLVLVSFSIVTDPARLGSRPGRRCWPERSSRPNAPRRTTR
jgi:hypothetical protein